MTKFDINYQKRKNTDFFKELEEHSILSMSKTQNYTPIYTHFFAMNETNYNNINLNHNWYVTNVKETLDQKHCFKCVLKHVDDSKKTETKDVFFKMAPLLDPFKYMVGKYKHDDPNLFNLPTFTNQKDIHPKIMDLNNSSYVDGFFSFLSSKLLSKKFVHGVDYYGSFIGIKNGFTINAIDDIDYLATSEFFVKNKNVLFQIQDYSHLVDEDSSQNNKMKPIKITEECELIDTEVLDDINDINEEVQTLNLADLAEMSIEELIENITIDDKTHTTSIKSSSSCSSRTSHTSDNQDSDEDDIDDIDDTKDEEENVEDDDENDKNDSSTEEGSYETISDDAESNTEEETLYAHIPSFPIQLIAMEKCEDTLDNLIYKSELTNEEWLSALMQIIMTLITYQKAFSFTHNDLHTNNIMYNATDKKYLYYFYKKKYYKVPTHGKIFKIIDFGRSIYKYNNILMCSDSFQPGGDAATQYNTEPYMNMNKPRLEPNYSFDLCRLACSIFDYLIEDMDQVKELTEKNPYIKIIVDWCLDDKGNNVLYKNNGSERYPDFKLYKMIARHVHNHTPNLQLERPEFAGYEINKNKIKEGEKVMNIDELCNLQNEN